MDTTKLWAKRSYETANLIVTFGYMIGALPVKWNKKENKMEPVTSRRDVFRYIFVTIFISFWQIAISVNFFRKFLALEGEKKLEFALQDIIRLGLVFISTTIFFLHLHTAWKYKEFVAFINRAAGFYEYFQNKYARKKEHYGYTKEDIISGMMKITFLTCAISISSMFVLAYLVQCRRHILFYILPICNSEYPMYTKIPIKILGSLFQFHFIAVTAAAMVLYVDLFAAVVLMGLYIVCEMRETNGKKRRTKKSLLQSAEWFHCFRSMELMVKELNDCIGDLFMPLHMMFVVIVTAFAIMALIRFDPEPMIVAILLIALALIALYYVLLIGRGSYLCQASQLALESIHGNMGSEYLRRKHRACRILKPNVGGLFPLKQHTVATMYQTSVELTSDLLLM